ncbi:MAG: site-2 protease family protein [Thermococcus sp.]|nr:site-2 protease family protein [Thermococcus sp.]
MSPSPGGRFHRRELEDIVISYLVLVLLFSNFDPHNVPYVVVAVLTAFVFHELAHRAVARHYGYVAYYKRWDTGIAVALLLGILTKLLTGSVWIFAALGAVYIYAPYQYWEDREAYGKISLAGPLVNIVVGVLAIALMRAFTPLTAPWWILKTTAGVNLWLAFFNLLPLPSLDGWKVIRWNTGYWAIATGAAYLLWALV